MDQGSFQDEQQGFAALAAYDPHMTVVKLPRCPNDLCPDPKHPLAYSPPHDEATCPGCGGPAAQAGEPIEVEALFVGEPQ